MAMHYLEIDSTCASESERIRSLLYDSYSVEAGLIGMADFPPLWRTSTDIRGSNSKFLGCVLNGTLVAVAELEIGDDESNNIASFAVHPSVFRQGIGMSLLLHVLHSYRGGRLTVSTAVRNKPAISLYEKHGFRIEKEWRTECGIDMVTLARM